MGVRIKIKKHNLVQVAATLVLIVIVGLSNGCQSRPEDSSLVVLSGLSDDWRYYLVDLQGHRTDISKKLGVHGITLFPAAWSPSGRQVAYVCALEKGGPSLICSVDVAKMALQTYPLPEGGYTESLTWSADEKGFLFRWGKGYPEPSAIWHLDVATQQLSMLSQFPAETHTWSWSPDRSSFAFVTLPPSAPADQDPWWEGQDLYIQSVDGTSKKLIYKNVAGSLAWSPDGTMIAFSADAPCWALVDSNEVNCLEKSGGGLVWSPDGKRIAFLSHDGIDVVDTQTRSIQNLVHKGEQSMYDLSWSPDGKYLAYDACCCMKPNGGCKVFIVSSDGKEHWQLTRNLVADEFPVWRPVAPPKN